MEIRSKEFAVRAEAAGVSEEDLALINERFALRPLEAEEVYVRRLALCNDQYDRTGERFPRAYLERFALTLPGKPLLAHHNKQQFPLGRFFRAEVGVGAEGESGPAAWLYCCVYLIKTPGNEEVRNQIDAGVYSHVSIGYRWADLTCDLCGHSYFRGECPHVIGQEYDGRACTATYAGDPARVEAVEGSLVYLGAQYGAVVTKSDDRQAEKAALSRDGRDGTPEPDLIRDGRCYRDELRREIARLSRCVGAEREGAALLAALGDADAPRLRELMEDYQRRFDAVFPPVSEAPAGAAALPRAAPPLQMSPE